MRLEGVDHVAFGVADQSRSVAWYDDVLGLTQVHREWERHPATPMQRGSGVALFPSDAMPFGFLHVAFRVDRASFEEAQKRLTARGIDFELVDHGTAESLYFADPDRVRPELTTYELG